MSEILHTERLTLRPFERRDLDAFAAYRRDPEVARYQAWEAEVTREAVERFLAGQEGLAIGTHGEWVQRAIVPRDGGDVLGDCSSRVLADQPGSVEIGITLARASQGRGIAHEALGALLSTLFRDHGLHRAVAYADDRNLAVHRLLRRLGMREEGRFVEADWFKGEWTTLRLFAVLAREWSA